VLEEVASAGETGQSEKDPGVPLMSILELEFDPSMDKRRSFSTAW